jgi:hypothetical protein
VKLRPLGTLATNWSIVPVPDDRWWWMWSSRWNENWQWKPNYSGKTCPSVTFPPQILHDLTSAGTRAAAVGSRRLTAWAINIVIGNALYKSVLKICSRFRVVTAVNIHVMIFWVMPTSRWLSVLRSVFRNVGNHIPGYTVSVQNFTIRMFIILEIMKYYSDSVASSRKFYKTTLLLL